MIKFIFDTISIDLLYASLDLRRFPDSFDILADNNLRNLDDAATRSLNGRRVTDRVLQLVPNVPAFRVTLRAIKLWAKVGARVCACARACVPF